MTPHTKKAGALAEALMSIRQRIETLEAGLKDLKVDFDNVTEALKEELAVTGESTKPLPSPMATAKAIFPTTLTTDAEEVDVATQTTTKPDCDASTPSIDDGGAIALPEKSTTASIMPSLQENKLYSAQTVQNPAMGIVKHTDPHQIMNTIEKEEDVLPDFSALSIQSKKAPVNMPEVAAKPTTFIGGLGASKYANSEVSSPSSNPPKKAQPMAAVSKAKSKTTPIAPKAPSAVKETPTPPKITSDPAPTTSATVAPADDLRTLTPPAIAQPTAYTNTQASDSKSAAPEPAKKAGGLMGSRWAWFTLTNGSSLEST